MPKMNTARIVLGGLLAGLIMNVSEAALHAGILGAETESLYQRLNAPPPTSIANPLTLVAVTFVLGITSVWLYAAVRPRFGGRTDSSSRGPRCVGGRPPVVGSLSGCGILRYHPWEVGLDPRRLGTLRSDARDSGWSRNLQGADKLKAQVRRAFTT